MTYRGTIRNGAVEFDEPVSLPEGTRIQCVVVPVEGPVQSNSDAGVNPYRELLAFAGTVTGWPSDASENLDHYLYGHPKT